MFAEHSHRLYGSMVGLACLGLVGVFSVYRAGWRGLLPLVLAAGLAGVAMLNPTGTIDVLGGSIPRGLAALAFVGLLAWGWRCGAERRGATGCWRWCGWRWRRWWDRGCWGGIGCG